MIIEQTFTVNAPPERTADFFCDISQVSSCIPGVEGVREEEDGSYAATLGVRLGPIRAAFQGSIALDASAAPDCLKASGQGRDRATGSMVKVDFSAYLAEDQPGVTTVRAVADLTIRGKLSQFGTGVMRAAAGEIVQEFAACANAKLADPPHRAEPAEATGGDAEDVQPLPTAAEPSVPAAPRQRGIIAVVVRGLLRSLATRLRRIVDRIADRLGSGVGRG